MFLIVMYLKLHCCDFVRLSILKKLKNFVYLVHVVSKSSKELFS